MFGLTFPYFKDCVSRSGVSTRVFISVRARSPLCVYVQCVRISSGHVCVFNEAENLALQELQAAERESRAVRPSSSLRPLGPHAAIPCQRKPMKIRSDFEETSRLTFLFLQGESA